MHSQDGQAYDWLDGAVFFKVVSRILIEGVANLNATASVVSNVQEGSPVGEESVSYG